MDGDLPTLSNFESYGKARPAASPQARRMALIEVERGVPDALEPVQRPGSTNLLRGGHRSGHRAGLDQDHLLGVEVLLDGAVDLLE